MVMHGSFGGLSTRPDGGEGGEQEEEEEKKEEEEEEEEETPCKVGETKQPRGRRGSEGPEGLGATRETSAAFYLPPPLTYGGEKRNSTHYFSYLPSSDLSLACHICLGTFYRSNGDERTWKEGRDVMEVEMCGDRGGTVLLWCRCGDD
ncbi:hypothetical protein E2C01_004709 [Portunus trituberculatus]|uniref:Uncharacterized protein n=1 Tax=Portunus trituberculatus TaxID=210409 RepID=A0A5B7CQP7_PORTR|nr:hypothetical protein [Portunus trituberculatus]